MRYYTTKKGFNMIDTKNLTLKKFQENFDFIEAKMKDSQIYKDALDSFVKYMPSYTMLYYR